MTTSYTSEGEWREFLNGNLRHSPTGKEDFMQRFAIEGIGSFYIVKKYFDGTWLCSKKNPKEECLSEHDVFRFDPMRCDFKVKPYRSCATLK